MITQIEKLCDHRVFYYFRQICQIPHGSGNEKALSDYILQWAANLGLEAEQDVANNVLIRKPATSGMEDVPGVMLQAHLDMVCEKDEGVVHDFKKDPIDWIIEGDMLSTGGKTTLGADDGIGVALIMAVLEDNTISHPAIEALFTTMEEEDMSGAEKFDGTKMKSHYLINLDHTVDNEVTCGSCGGMQVDFKIPVEQEAVPEGWSAYKLSVLGLKGGHSGEDIHRGRGNANILLARLLMEAEKHCTYFLSSIRGGSFRLAIPRDAEAVLGIEPSHVLELKSIFESLEADMRAELSDTNEQLKVVLEPTETVKWGVKPDKIISAMVLIPDGIYQMNETLTGLVDTSDNLGEMYLENNELHLVLEIRSARESLRSYLYQRMERLATLLGGYCEYSSIYPSWNFYPISQLRRICRAAYQECYNSEPEFHTVHAGLEVGYLLKCSPETDAISIGPNCWDFHSPTEKVQISSVKKFYVYLCKLLALIQ